MKQLDDAVDLFGAGFDKPPTAAELDSARERIQEGVERYSQLLHEAMASDKVHTIADAIVRSCTVAAGEITEPRVAHLLFLEMTVLAFAHGVCVGVEMEKQDFVVTQ